MLDAAISEDKQDQTQVFLWNFASKTVPDKAILKLIN